MLKKEMRTSASMQKRCSRLPAKSVELFSGKEAVARWSERADCRQSRRCMPCVSATSAQSKIDDVCAEDVVVVRRMNVFCNVVFIARPASNAARLRNVLPPFSTSSSASTLCYPNTHYFDFLANFGSPTPGAACLARPLRARMSRHGVVLLLGCLVCAGRVLLSSRHNCS